MMDPNKMSRQLAQSGKLEQVKKLAASDAAATLAASIDREQLQKAAEKQDPTVLRAVLEQVLSTDEGKQLAQKVKAAMQDG